MSLKAKLEAVIYAAEEPVTLAQLAAIFGNEALELKAERGAAAAAAAAQAETPAGETQPLLDEGFAYLGLEQTPAFYAAPAAEAGSAAAGEASGELPAAAESAEQAASAEAAVTSETPLSQEPQPTPATSPEIAATPEAAPDPEAEAKKAARMREREVRSILEGLIEELKASYDSDERGIEIREIAGGYRMATKPEYHDGVRAFIRSLKPPLKLSLQALETLAVVAYKQPVTAPEVSEIRGVESAGTLGSLLGRKLIATAGRKQVIGRPILYKTTREFLLRFGLKDISELPSMEEFEKMAAIELDEPPAAPSDSAVENGDLSVDAALDRTDTEEGLDQESGETATEGTAADPEAGQAASHSAEPEKSEAAAHGE